MISFGRSICSEFQSASGREWLETNGLGGYALSTVCSASTRRHHGLLVVAQEPPGKRLVLLNRIEEKISGSGWTHSISCQQYPDTIHDRGYEFLENFSVNPFPAWTYLVEDARIKKSFFLVSGENTAVIMYELLSGSPVQLEIRPLVSMRPIQSLLKKNSEFDDTCTATDTSVLFAKEDVLPFGIKSTNGFFQKNPCWYYDLIYTKDSFDTEDIPSEDLYSPGMFRLSLREGEHVGLIASTEPLNSLSLDKLYYKEVFIRNKITENSPVKGDFARLLLQAGDQFIVSTAQTTSIVKGYPWYGESIKETCIALPGLCLVNGRFPEAKEILVRIFNLFSGVKFQKYPIDTVLWFFWSVQKYVEHSGDFEFIRTIHKQLMLLCQNIRRGIPGLFKMDTDGLICYEASDPLFNGKPAGIQALWYNALQFMEEIEIKFGLKRKRYKDLALRIRESFNEVFWNNDNSYLFNAVSHEHKDPAIKPDALLALSLPYTVLDQKKFSPVFSTAWKKLYSSYGLRSGEMIYPYLIGSFINAYFNVYGHQAQAKMKAWQFLTPFFDHMSESLIGSIQEFFEGTRPYKPRGSPSMAINVAEIIRVLVEEIGCQPEQKNLSINDIMSAKNGT
ncbi:MAG: glycogen debranching enzyme N-terminal domain-containing protein [bacterium]